MVKMLEYEKALLILYFSRTNLSPERHKWQLSVPIK